MALLTDGNISTTDEILQMDIGTSEAGRAEGISLDHKLSLAERDCRLKVTQFVLNQGLEARLGVVNTMPRLDRVVINEALRKWHGLHTLELFYSDAYYRSLNDRYERKYEFFMREAAAAWEQALDIGIPCTFDPVGRGRLDRVEVVPAVPGVAAGTYYVAIRWGNANGKTGDLSEQFPVSVSAGEAINVVPGVAGEGVTSYDVFAGTTEGKLFKQNSEPQVAGVPYNLGSVQVGGESSEGITETIDFVLRRSRVLHRG